jgi:hypothetical protein
VGINQRGCASARSDHNEAAFIVGFMVLPAFLLLTVVPVLIATVRSLS